jgi:hypothetical protein
LTGKDSHNPGVETGTLRSSKVRSTVGRWGGIPERRDTLVVSPRMTILQETRYWSSLIDITDIAAAKGRSEISAVEEIPLDR